MDRCINVVEYVYWLREQARLKRPYWYGCYHIPCTESLLQRKAKQYPSHYTSNRMSTYRKHIAAKQIAGDCVNGAIKGAVWTELGTRDPHYQSHGCPDKSADGMLEFCKKQGMEWGAIKTIPDKPGIAVRFSGHVGIYVGNGEVVEWKGFNYGCVVTQLKKGKWTHWYELPWIIYDTAPAEPLPEVEGIPDTGNLGSRLLKRGRKGEDVRILQELLMLIGYELPKYGADGDYGAETETAVEKFQRTHGLEADGEYGQLSHAELMGVIAELTAENESETPEAQPETVKYITVTGSRVNIREGAGTAYDVITVVKKDERLEWVATAANGWHCAKLSDGRAGWISGNYSRMEE